MKSLIKISLFAVATVAMIGCAPPANTNTNTAVNTNTNAAPKAAAPTADTFTPMENKAFEAWKAKDGKYFEGYIADNFVPGPGESDKIKTKADVVKMISENKCDVKSFALSDGHVTPVGADAAVYTYKVTQDGTCDGKPVPSTVTAATVFVRSGDSWKAAYHNEVAVMAPKADAKAADANANAAKPAAAEKKEAPAAAPAAKDDKPAANSSASHSNSSAPSNSNSAGSGDALTDAIVAVERKGWEAWKNQDAKALEETVGNDIAFIDITGKTTYGKADVIKGWTNGECKVSSVNVSDAKATSISKDAAILIYKGTAVGTCGDMKLGPLWGTTVAVKEGDTWKAVYIFETPIGKM